MKIFVDIKKDRDIKKEMLLKSTSPYCNLKSF